MYKKEVLSMCIYLLKGKLVGQGEAADVTGGGGAMLALRAVAVLSGARGEVERALRAVRVQENGHRERFGGWVAP